MDQRTLPRCFFVDKTIWVVSNGLDLIFEKLFNKNEALTGNGTKLCSGFLFVILTALKITSYSCTNIKIVWFLINTILTVPNGRLLSSYQLQAIGRCLNFSKNQTILMVLQLLWSEGSSYLQSKVSPYFFKFYQNMSPFLFTFQFPFLDYYYNRLRDRSVLKVCLKNFTGQKEPKIQHNYMRQK